ncbi:MAG TPA: 3-oxoacyl-[acyl-carrier-protein] reductase [Syntrophales bacterium]|nr:3-oxoacyl-[acyl-carrier-protein] reductase [Syntrophales bacterium]HOL58733.1 3-oxoacyl-[acyl-carrier-protein] reductase [Syntrophales bacterium]HPO34979.1 3-oxoacyl-[acyl-carrier-protein] reductase [Syntrophales bacterium]
MIIDLHGRVALVSGASRGIGRAVAVKLARSGAFTYVNFVSNEEAARETMKMIHEQGGEGDLLKFPVEDRLAVGEAVRKIIEEKGRIDILVNNAGIWMGGPSLRLRAEQWKRVMEVNLEGTFNLIQASVRAMMKQRWGRIINISSVIALSGNSGDALYGASKAGIVGMTKSLAREFASRNICVNAVAPGFIETDMTKDIPEEMKRAMCDMIPLRRLGRADDVAGMVAFLSSEEASYITGQVIHINGGLYM